MANGGFFGFLCCNSSAYPLSDEEENLSLSGRVMCGASGQGWETDEDSIDGDVYTVTTKPQDNTPLLENLGLTPRKVHVVQEAPAGTVLDLAFRPCELLPLLPSDQARRIVRIDLTATGIRTLQGLHQFPRLRTLVLDQNKLPTLPNDCPEMPRLDTLSFCRNNVEDLELMLSVTSRCFPGLTALLLIGNPVCPTASRPRDETFERWYRLSSLHQLPQLEELDNCLFTEEDRVVASTGNLTKPGSLHKDAVDEERSTERATPVSSPELRPQSRSRETSSLPTPAPTQSLSLPATTPLPPPLPSDNDSRRQAPWAGAEDKNSNPSVQTNQLQLPVVQEGEDEDAEEEQGKRQSLRPSEGRGHRNESENLLEARFPAPLPSPMMTPTPEIEVLEGSAGSDGGRALPHSPVTTPKRVMGSSKKVGLTLPGLTSRGGTSSLSPGLSSHPRQEEEEEEEEEGEEEGEEGSNKPTIATTAGAAAGASSSSSSSSPSVYLLPSPLRSRREMSESPLSGRVDWTEGPRVDKVEQGREKGCLHPPSPSEVAPPPPGPPSLRSPRSPLDERRGTSLLSPVQSRPDVVHGTGWLQQRPANDSRYLVDRTTLPSFWDREAIVINVGAGRTKVGLAGMDHPTDVFPTIVGRVDRGVYDLLGGQEIDTFVGHDALREKSKPMAERELSRPRPLWLSQPMNSGMVEDWDDMEALLKYGVESVMGLDAVEHPLLLSDSVVNPQEGREKAVEIIFETMSTPAVHMALEPILAMYACGQPTGLVVDIGDSGTQVAPVTKGFLDEKGVSLFDIKGRDLTHQLGVMINAKSGLVGGSEFGLEDPIDLAAVEAVKESICFVSENLAKDNAKMELSMRKVYTLPDGSTVTLGRERYQSMEMLFSPSAMLRATPSLQDSILDVIGRCPPSSRKGLAKAVLVVGGTAELAGMSRRLQRELTMASREKGLGLKFTVMVPEDCANTVWFGGSALASSGSLKDSWLTRAEYEEYGSTYIHERCGA